MKIYFAINKIICLLLCFFVMLGAVSLTACSSSEDTSKNEEQPPLEEYALALRAITNINVGDSFSEDKVEAFEKGFEESFGEDAEIPPSNLARTKQLQIETPEVTVKVNAGHSEVVQSRIIDGVKYILIRADSDITVNGVSIQI